MSALSQVSRRTDPGLNCVAAASSNSITGVILNLNNQFVQEGSGKNAKNPSNMASYCGMNQDPQARNCFLFRSKLAWNVFED